MLTISIIGVKCQKFLKLKINKKVNKKVINMKTEKHAEIKCPQCGHVQKAKIRKTFPFYTYIHYCEKCNYVITESDWNEIKTVKS